MSKVYFSDLNSNSKSTSIPNKIKKIFEAAGFKNIISEGDNVALKLHFGEKGNTTYIHPVYIRQIVDKVKEAGGKPFLTDTNTLYSGSRTNSVDHIVTAIENGFAYSVVGAPIIIADGLYSKNVVEVVINKKHFEKVKIAGEIYNSSSMIVISHFKGHGMAGFGGCIKNLAMGCATASGKQMQHSDAKPTVKAENCIGCTKCIKDCPVLAIKMENKKAIIDKQVCYGCGECITRCPVRAISIQWETDNDVFIEKMGEYAYGSILNKKDKVVYINFVKDITPMCDCVPWSGRPIAQDIGILASTDPVALDKASYDLVVKAAGKDVFKELYPNVNANNIFDYCESLGMGSQNYELVEII
ncbi:hypothetical protein SAMN05661008_00980 [Alkalithermobacter thermoalcaliphilus JW-YL-7 = DSM 7308]|uniref:Ferredoxin n=1 Tax=Alkalithermobacter thermoalcaliphilus JW-YL-7 = DSM 7308 TaxID=1121328 RepID=A0A150FNU8_CLOPD|nr:protein of unknown function DUF362 [[Clostridium] paradoxum JW-YL-7 = DSM 7308]SHK84015.1 hypothetical protein SAMN05661008_00980 [[Clostridium] paradoxum JW-YL-7 = DSM 7308]